MGNLCKYRSQSSKSGFTDAKSLTNSCKVLIENNIEFRQEVKFKILWYLTYLEGIFKVRYLGALFLIWLWNTNLNPGSEASFNEVLKELILSLCDRGWNMDYC